MRFEIKMDETEDSSYLALLNVSTHNYLLQTTDETLAVQDPTLNVEPIFTEIEDGTTAWSVGLPILMNGSLISEADQQLESPLNISGQNCSVESSIDLSENLSEFYEEPMENKGESSLQEPETSEESQVSYPIEIPGLFITNDLLYPLKLNLVNDVSEDANLDLATEDLKNKVTEPQNILINPKTLTQNNEFSTGKVNITNYESSSRTKDSTVNSKIRFSSNSSMNGLRNEQILNMTNLNTVNDVTKRLDTDRSIVNKQSSHSDINKSAIKELLTNDFLDSNSEIFDIIVAHKCRQCPFLCEERIEIIRHWQTQHQNVQKIEGKNNLLKCTVNGELKMKSILKNTNQQTVYICSECNLGYGSTEKLRNHMIIVHRLLERPGETTIDGEDKGSQPKTVVTKPKITLADIQRQAKASKKIKCSVKGCDMRFSMDDMRIRHEKCHIEGQKKQFKCYECGSKFSIWRVCSLHLWKCHNVDLGLYRCQMCSTFKTTTPVRLITHMATHENEKPYLCSTCGKTFKQHSQLKNHQIIHKDIDKVPEWATQQQCDICKKFFANSKCLKKHVQSVHDKFKPFICNICGHKTTRKAMLELHLRQHTGEKPHKCPICEYKTGDHNSLRRHVMRHSGDTKYACPHCNYQSIQSTSYKNHIANKHPGLGGSYFCSVCFYHTVNENTYISHLADHKNGLITVNKNNNVSKEEKITNGIVNKKQKITKEIEEDETQNYLLNLDHSNDAVDTGGITIPAGLELQVLH